MKEVRLAFVGFGNVAQGLTQILLEQEEELARKYGVCFIITAITDTTKGSAFNPDGLSPASLLAAAGQPGALRSLPGEHPDWDAMDMIQSSPADVVIEMSITNLETGEPATSYIAEALRRKKHVITTNKGPIALHYDTLQAIARLHDVQIGVEGTVMSGTPVLHMGRNLLAGAGIQSIEGILNGTTNFIITRMEEGISYEEALKQAQALGYAEADPSGDGEGFDAAAKVAILSRLILDTTIPIASVNRQGMTGLTLDDIARARSEGKRWKMLGVIKKEENQITASVSPVQLDKDHPLARIEGAANAVVFNTNYLGPVTLTGPGAGREQTGYAIIQDLLNIFHGSRSR